MKKFLKDYAGFGEHTFSKIFITSDTHFGHDKIHAFEPIREELRLADKFEGTPDEYLVHKWNEQVSKGDLVIHLGDLHWSSFEHVADKLNGTILLVLGNHDHKPQYYYKFPNVYVVEGIWDLTDIPYEYHIVDSEDKLLSAFVYNGIMYSHYPIYHIEHEYNYQRRNNNIVDRMKILKAVADSYEEPILNIHGHMHSNHIECPMSLNVCIDYNKYKIRGFAETFLEARRASNAG